MELHKQDKYSKSHDPDEIEEVLMDEELEDTDKVVEPRVLSSSPSENVADWLMRDSVANWLENAIHSFSRLLSKVQVLSYTVVSDVTLSVANWYILHKFTGDL
jgi:hypothetical protein